MQEWKLVDNLKYRVRASRLRDTDSVYVGTGTPIKDTVDLRKWDSPVEDQSHLGSCAAEAIVSAYEILCRKVAQGSYEDLSRLFVYYNGRLLENLVEEDSGIYLRDGLESVKVYGVCLEKLWPYRIDHFNIKPDPECYVDAVKRLITEYHIVPDHEHILQALSDGTPVIIGMSVYESFGRVDKANPVVPLSTDREDDLGGHAMVAVGYDLHRQCFLIKNSFGTDWGDDGYAWLPFDYARTNMFERWCFSITDPLTWLLLTE